MGGLNCKNCRFWAECSGSLNSEGSADEMRLFRYQREDGAVGCGVITPDGQRVDAGGLASDYDEAFFTRDGLEILRDWLGRGAPGGAPVSEELRLLAPVARPSKIICVGKNYLAHAEEMGGDLPTEPLLFMKASTAWSGPFDSVIVPRDSDQLDYEVELAVILEKRGVHVEQTEVRNIIAGYTVFCDYSERGFQNERGGQWVKGKSCDTFAPAGPELVTGEEVPDPQDLGIWTKVNGEIRQHSATSEMIFSVEEIVSYISRFMTLLPGDVIATGTPAGVGAGYDPPRYLRAGDIVELGIERVGEMRQTVVGGD